MGEDRLECLEVGTLHVTMVPTYGTTLEDTKRRSAHNLRHTTAVNLTQILRPHALQRRQLMMANTRRDGHQLRHGQRDAAGRMRRTRAGG